MRTVREVRALLDAVNDKIETVHDLARRGLWTSTEKPDDQLKRLEGERRTLEAELVEILDAERDHPVLADWGRA